MVIGERKRPVHKALLRHAEKKLLGLADSGDNIHGQAHAGRFKRPFLPRFDIHQAPVPIFHRAGAVPTIPLKYEVHPLQSGWRLSQGSGRQAKSVAQPDLCIDQGNFQVPGQGIVL
jgi:hypothetical protein